MRDNVDSMPSYLGSRYSVQAVCLITAEANLVKMRRIARKPEAPRAASDQSMQKRNSSDLVTQLIAHILPWLSDFNISQMHAAHSLCILPLTFRRTYFQRLIHRISKCLIPFKTVYLLILGRPGFVLAY